MLKRLQIYSTRMTIVSLAFPALTLPALLHFAGASMAIGLRLYAGDFEPSEPELAFPWLQAYGLSGTGLALAAAEVALGKRWLAWIGLILLILSCGVSIAHLMSLYELASE